MPQDVARVPAPAGSKPTTAVPSIDPSLPANQDVVIIGAGAAGLAAGLQLTKKGISFVIVEAAGRVGGRAYTESGTFGQPVDHGCSWISGSDNNVFTGYGKRGGFTLVEHTSAGTSLFDIEGNPADEADRSAYARAGNAIDRALSKAGRAGKDVAGSSVISEQPYSATVQSWMGAMDYGVDFDNLSTADYWHTGEDQPSYIVREGLGAIVATLATGLPISLNNPVSAIDYSRAGVTVETAKGTLQAKACLVTVSTGVLAADKIKFTPALPPEKQQAIADIPMGLLIKVPLLFDGARLDLPENNWVTYRIPENKAGEACYFVAWPCGHDYLFGNIGGRFGWDLYADGHGAVVDYALDQLSRNVGSHARKHFIKGIATDWADNPLTLGAYGSPKPGRLDARKTLAAPLAEKVFFAGEAMGGHYSALVNGAYNSGRKTAKAMSKVLA